MTFEVFALYIYIFLNMTIWEKLNFRNAQFPKVQVFVYKFNTLISVGLWPFGRGK